MKQVLKGVLTPTEEGIKKLDLALEDGRILALSDHCDSEDAEVIPCDNFFVTPGLIDVHVHFREPGFEYKETIGTGSFAARVSGYQTVCTMPNLDPAPYDMTNLDIQREAIRKGAHVEVKPYGRITRDGSELADLELLAPYVCAFSDDGKGVQGVVDMSEAMERAKALGKLIVEHCEDERFDTYDPRSEYMEVIRDLDLAALTGCGFHVCHVSSRVTVDIIAKAKARENAVDVTCETAPHYLLFNNQEGPFDKEGRPTVGNFKMNPPIRDPEDQEALIEGIKDGTIDMIVTDHAPHSAEEKAKGPEGPFGIVGLETAFPVMYTHFVKTGIISFDKLYKLMCVNPSKRFGIGRPYIKEGDPADFFVFDLETPYTIDSATFVSKGKSTPFDGMEVYGRVLRQVIGGEWYDPRDFGGEQ